MLNMSLIVVALTPERDEWRFFDRTVHVAVELLELEAVVQVACRGHATGPAPADDVGKDDSQTEQVGNFFISRSCWVL